MEATSTQVRVSARPDAVGDWIVTYSGRPFWPLDPQPEDVCIEDIAHALANLCRFTGHTSEFYSVAQHSVMVARYFTPRTSPVIRMHALLHDAHEAYLNDVARPLKGGMLHAIPANTSPFPASRIIAHRVAEDRIQAAIVAALGVPPMDVEYQDAIKHADNVALATEKRDLMHRSGWATRLPDPLPEPIKTLLPGPAKGLFLAEFDRLKGLL